MKPGLQWKQARVRIQDWLRLRVRLFVGNHPVTHLDGIAVVDLRTEVRDGGDFECAMSEAMLYLRSAEGGLAALVTAHLRQIVAVNDGLESVSPTKSAYYLAAGLSDFRADRGVYLGGKLVWAATFIGIMRHHPWWRRSFVGDHARAQAAEVQRQFARQFRT